MTGKLTAIVAACLSIAAALSGCATSPADPPAPVPVQVPAAWSSPVPWTQAKPAADQDKGPWWQLFQDKELDRLVSTALTDSPTLAAVAARLRQAQAGVDSAEAGRWPRADAGLRSVRQRSSANRPSATSGGAASSSTQTDHALSLGVSYEVDLFNRVALEVDQSRALEAQARADLVNAQLVLAAEMASAYFSLRQVDTELAVIEQSIRLQERAVALFKARHEGGAASGLDVAQQEAQLDVTRTQSLLLQRQRPALEHALATLCGKTASEFHWTADAGWRLQPPAVPVALPSAVLQRRPDIAAAQQAVASANAQIGIARTASFPSLVLATGAGLESRDLARLLDGPSLLWSLGLNAAQNVFDGGRNQARLAGARAAHEAVSASYRQTVLRALQEVEDGLSGLRALGAAQERAQAAVLSAQRALDIAQARYSGGLATALDVITAQQTLLSNRRQTTQISTQQLTLTAFLVKALGGGWIGA